ncbi:MAG: alanine racemase [Candidatus Caldatribacteriaceae bacterium]
MYPCLEIDLGVIRDNAITLREKCCLWNVSPVVVTKGFLADPPLVEVLWEQGFTRFADSNLANLVKLRHLLGHRAELSLIRLPMLEELEALVEESVLPFVSHHEILEELNAVAQRKGKVQPVFLAMEGGDGREGLLFEELPLIVEHLRCLSHVSVRGIGTTMACLSGVLPDGEVINYLRKVKEFLQGRLKGEVLISVGGTTFLALWEGGKKVREVDEVRFGEALLFGSDISRKQDIPWLKQGAFTLYAEVVEVRTKEPLKNKRRGYDAFGSECPANDDGPRKRVLVAVGKQDIDENQLYSEDVHAKIVGATSNYLVLDVEESGRVYRVGDVVAFRAGYGAVLRAFLSPYVEKVYKR